MRDFCVGLVDGRRFLVEKWMADLAGRVTPPIPLFAAGCVGVRPHFPEATPATDSTSFNGPPNSFRIIVGRASEARLR